MFDVLLKGGTIVDGTGASAYPADIGVFGDRIEAMGRFDAASAEVTVDASGQIVTPGFIDLHTHRFILNSWPWIAPKRKHKEAGGQHPVQSVFCNWNPTEWRKLSGS